jgi:hypothetical protein
MNQMHESGSFDLRQNPTPKLFKWHSGQKGLILVSGF